MFFIQKCYLISDVMNEFEVNVSICRSILIMQSFAYIIITRYLTPILGTICTVKAVQEMIASLFGKRKPRKTL